MTTPDWLPKDWRDEDYVVEDCTRIVEVCAGRGLKITPGEAFAAWHKFSDNADAGWLSMGLMRDDDVWRAVSHWHKRDPIRRA